MMRSRAAFIRWAVFGAALACAPQLCAQEPPGPIHPPSSTAPQKPPSNLPESPTPQPQTQQRPLRVRVTEITAPVTVRDRNGELVLNLEQKDFHIFDNEAEQKIDHFDLGGDPLAIALLVETSSRVESLLPAVKQSGIVFTQTVMGPTAEAAVLSYDGTVDIRENFSSDSDAIEGAVQKLPLGTSSARLYDGIGKAVALLSNQPPRERRILLVVGEAIDSGSETKLGAALRGAELANVTIYTIGLSTTAAEFRNPPKQYTPASIGPPGTFPVPTPPGVPETPETEEMTQGNMDLLSLAIWIVQHASNAVKNHSLEVATEATGGRHISTMKDLSIQKAMDQIGGELHAQYTLGYRPAADSQSGFHEIRVTVDRPGLRIRTRPGYYLPPPM